MSRPLPPPLEFPYPPCSICGEECQLDGGWYCPACEASWDCDTAHLYDGHWYGGTVPQCPSVVRPWEDKPEFPTIQDTEYRCFLDQGHRGDGRGADLHRHPEYFGGWNNTDNHVYEVTE